MLFEKRKLHQEPVVNHTKYLTHEMPNDQYGNPNNLLLLNSDMYTNQIVL